MGEPVKGSQRTPPFDPKEFPELIWAPDENPPGPNGERWGELFVNLGPSGYPIQFTHLLKKEPRGFRRWLRSVLNGVPRMAGGVRGRSR